MWLMSYMTRNSLEKPAASKGTSARGAEGSSVTAAGEHKTLPLCLPYGVFSIPPDGCSAVVLPLDDGEVALGVTDNSANIESGEVALFSRGGASLILKNNGDVVINGQVF